MGFFLSWYLQRQMKIKEHYLYRVGDYFPEQLLKWLILCLQVLGSHTVLIYKPPHLRFIRM